MSRIGKVLGTLGADYDIMRFSVMLDDELVHTEPTRRDLQRIYLQFQGDRTGEALYIQSRQEAAGIVCRLKSL